MKVAPRVWTALYAGVVAACLVMVATYYHPGRGFTAFLELPIQNHDRELPAVRAVPHVDHEGSGGYDGQFYAQLAVEPLLADRAIDVALDTPPYRARRILMSWVSYAAGLGRPAAVLHIYAVHAVVAWLVLAWLLTRWMPPVNARHAVLGAAALLAHGPMMSVRYALPDLAAAVIVALAVMATERGRVWAAGLLLGAAGLARDSSLAAGAMLLRFVDRDPWRLVRVGLAGLVAVAPLLLWIDYIYSIYRSTTWLGSDQFVWPLRGLIWKAQSIAGAVSTTGVTWLVVQDGAAAVAFVAQAGWLLWLAVARRDGSAWVLTGLGFLALGLVADPVVWEGIPGAYPRVVLPMMLAARVTLAREPRGRWWLIGLTSLDVIPGIAAL